MEGNPHLHLFGGILGADWRSTAPEDGIVIHLMSIVCIFVYMQFARLCGNNQTEWLSIANPQGLTVGLNGM